MDRKAFHLLLKRYLDGTSSEAEHRLVDHWYELLDDEMPVAITENELQAMESRIWNSIQRKAVTQEAFPADKPASRKIWRKLTVAAMVASLLAGAWWYLAVYSKTNTLVSDKVQEGLLEEVNNTNITRQIVLEDGSRVRLAPMTKIAFPRHFLKSKREVYLEGEAFFEVTKNPGHPFFVFNKTLVAEVLGTSFNIRIIKNKIEVAVRTGRVAVFENGQKIKLNSQQKLQNGVIITPNQKVTYYTENRHFVTSLVETPVPVDTQKDAALSNPVFIFDDAPLAEVLGSLEKAYQIEIVLENDNLGKCPFTGDISKQTLFNKLELVCSAFQANYEIKGTRILIKGGISCK